MPEEALKEDVMTVEEAVEEGLDSLLSDDPEQEDKPVDEAVERTEENDENKDDEDQPINEDQPIQEVITPDYTVPEDLNERSTGRFNKLVEDNKTQRDLVGEHEKTLTGMREMVSSSGLTNEEYLGAIDFAAEIKRDPAKGMKRMQEYMTQVSKATGIPIEMGEVDMLEGFPDLKQDVDDMALTEERAAEIARSRKTQASQDIETQRHEAKATQENNYAVDQKVALNDVSVFIGEISKSDIDWEAKHPMLFEAAQYARDNLPPGQWKAHLESEYNKINRIAAAVLPKKTETPLTDKSNVRGGQKEPTTIGEALDQLL